MNDIIEKIYFGIELETCICSLKYKNLNQERERKDQTIINEEELNLFYEHLVEIAKTKGENIWEDKSKNKPDYSMWNIVYDASVHCNIDRYINTKGYFFFPIEIISPIFNANEEGFKRLKACWDTYIIDKHFIYSTNETQGFHIHISNPELNKLKLLKLWYVFEDIFFKIFPSRINNILIASLRESLHRIYGTEDGVTIIQNLTEEGQTNSLPLVEKFNAVNFTIPDKTHVEFRIHPGTMDFTQIYNWIKVVLIFTAYTIKNNTKDSDLVDINNFDIDKKFYYLFSNIIADKSLLEYYSGVIVKNDIKKYNLVYPTEDIIPCIPQITDTDKAFFGIFLD